MIEEEKKIIEELKKIVKELKKEFTIVPIHFDKKRQIYTIRIPVAFARAANITEKDKFKFNLMSVYSERKQKLNVKIIGWLIR